MLFSSWALWIMLILSESFWGSDEREIDEGRGKAYQEQKPREQFDVVLLADLMRPRRALELEEGFGRQARIRTWAIVC